MKYTFYETGLTLVDGELVEIDPKPVTFNFSLKMSGLKLFEQEYGKPLLKTLTNIARAMTIAQSLTGDEDEELKQGVFMNVINELDEKAIKALAASSYIKIENNTAYNNENTVEEFKESFAYGLVMNDMEFITSLITMAINQTFSKGNGNGDNKTKK